MNFSQVAISEFLKPRILVDTSYCIYYCMFSAYSWYAKEFNCIEDPNWDPITEPEFRKAFENKFRKNILSAAKMLCPMATYDNTIFALDTSKNKIWRNELKESYKLERKMQDKSQNPFSYAGAFRYTIDTILPAIQDEYKNVRIISNEFAEGDDVIAVCTKNIPEDEVKVIVATDKDLGQLLKYKNTRIISLQQKELTCIGESDKIRALNEANYVMTPKDLLLKKILIGDKADGISAIMPRFGDAKAAQYILDKQKLEDLLQNPENEHIKIKFEENRRLIDFEYIPEEIQNNILEQLNSKTSDTTSTDWINDL